MKLTESKTNSPGQWGRLAAITLLVAIVAGPRLASAEDVNIYSERKEALIRPVIDAFTADTGINVNLVTGKAAQLHERLVAEGANTPADLLITVDAGNLHRAKTAGLLQPVRSDALNSAIPEAFRDVDSQWFGLSLRARIIIFANDRVAAGEITTYEALADEDWRNRIAIRSSGNVYNQSLIASMIEAHGVEGAEAWARGLVANFARDPKGGDTDQIRAVAAGEADIAVVNSYYFGRLQASADEADRAVAEAVTVVFPNQQDRGTHVNVAGAGITAHAKNGDNALKLLEFMASPAGQKLFAELNHEFPVTPGIARSETVAAWGEFITDGLPLSRLGERNSEAIRLADRAGWR